MAVVGLLMAGGCADIEADHGQLDGPGPARGSVAAPIASQSEARAGTVGVTTPTTTPTTSGDGQTPAPYANWGWKATASSATTGVADQALNALDGDIVTRWTTGRAQAGDESFVVDFGEPVPMSKIVLDDTMHPDEYPAAYRLEVSDDGVTFRPVETGTGTTVSIVCFHEVTARYLRVCQTGATTATWWSIDELRVYR